MIGRRVLWRAAGVVAGALLGSACGGGLLFAKDARVKFVAPRDGAAVTTPVHLRWVGDGAPRRDLTYAVFVDALPVHPGQNLRALAGPQCARVRSCIDLAWLNRHFVFVTNQPSLDLDTLPILGTAKGERDIHTATIVLVDSDWRRSGESSWTVSFDVRHRRAP